MLAKKNLSCNNREVPNKKPLNICLAVFYFVIFSLQFLKI